MNILQIKFQLIKTSNISITELNGGIGLKKCLGREPRSPSQTDQVHIFYVAVLIFYVRPQREMAARTNSVETNMGDVMTK